MKCVNSYRQIKFLKDPFDSDIAEMIGILLGDGSIYRDKKGKLHVSIFFHKQEKKYLFYVKRLFETKLYPYKFSFFEVPTTYVLRNVSITVGTFFIKSGLIVGNKKHNNVGIPIWVFKNKEYLIKTLRGIFDTDGCVYRKYKQYAQVQFKFAGIKLIEDTKRALELLGFTPTKIMKDYDTCKRLQWKVYLSRQKEIDQFMFLINPKNPKNWKRYHKIKNGDAGI